jgi:hypothetical protein
MLTQPGAVGGWRDGLANGRKGHCTSRSAATGTKQGSQGADARYFPHKSRLYFTTLLQLVGDPTTTEVYDSAREQLTQQRRGCMQEGPT